MKQHLETLTIERFRGLRDLELKDCRQVNLFVGINNSGKTSTLEAISTYCRSLDPLEWLSTSRRREAFSSGRMTPITRLDALRWLFPQTLEQNPEELYHGKASIRATGSFAVKSVIADYQEIRGIPDEATLESITRQIPSHEPDATYRGAELQVNTTAYSSTQNESVKDNRSDFVFWEAAPYRQKLRAPYALPVKTITPVSHRTDIAVERYSDVVLKGQKESMLDLVRLFDPGIVGMQILGRGGTSLYLEHKESGLTPLSAFGDGVRRAVMIALTLPNIKNGVLLIDEIETAIHISVLNEVYRWLFKACQQFNAQLFATTHSLEAVDALLNAHPAPFDELVVYRLGQHGEPARRFGGELLNRLRSERGLDVR